MKKSLVVLMAVVMTFAFAAATVAADLSYWAGGDMYFYFDSEEHGLLESAGTFMVDGGLPMVKVTNGNTYAQAWLNQDKWRTPGGQWRFAFGWNKIGDVLDLGFSTKDTGVANIGQIAITDQFNSFHADPIFNTFDNPYAVNANLVVGNFNLKAEYNVAPETGHYGANTTDFHVLNGLYAVSMIFKLDSGDIHAGYKSAPETTLAPDGGYLAMIGGAFVIGDTSLKVDMWRDNGRIEYEWGGTGSIGTYRNDGDEPVIADGGQGTGLQVNVGINKLDATLFVFNPKTDNLDTEVGLGANYKFDKLTVGAKYFKDINPAGDNAWEAFGLYNVGAFDVKFGAMDYGSSDDTSLILGFHAGLW